MRTSPSRFPGEQIASMLLTPSDRGGGQGRLPVTQKGACPPQCESWPPGCGGDSGYSALFCGRPWAFSGLLILLSLAGGHRSPHFTDEDAEAQSVKSLSASGQSCSRLRPSSSWGRAELRQQTLWARSRPGVYLLLNTRALGGKVLEPKTPRWEQACGHAQRCFLLALSAPRAQAWGPVVWVLVASPRPPVQVAAAGEVEFSPDVGRRERAPLLSGGRLFSVMTR